MTEFRLRDSKYFAGTIWQRRSWRFFALQGVILDEEKILRTCVRKQNGHLME